ncbi:MAG: NADP-dependent oxidoreductase [Phycisphaerales bacterium]|nr:NADP-dependent oxidoreductase [Phycisphaerales bacterium]
MKAIRIHKFGGADQLTYEDAPKPEASVGQVLVKVHAAGVNPVDYKIRNGMFGAGKFPMTLGFDVSGTVEEVGQDASRFKAGDSVYSYLPLTAGGGYAEYVAVPASAVAIKPNSLDHAAAAAVPLAALTAWQALFDKAGLKEGQSVLIHGAAGGVGHFAVQFAKAKGAKVLATASADHHEFLKTLGTDVIIDYKTQKFEEFAKDVDVVLDTVGGETQARSIGVIKKDGFLVSIVGQPNPAKLKEAGIRGTGFLVQPNADQLKEIAALIDGGKVKPHVTKVFPLAEAAQAHAKIEEGHTQGKIVLEVIPGSASAPAVKK